MSANALNGSAPQFAMASRYLCDEYLTAPHFPPRGPLEPWCASVSDHLQEAIRDRQAHIDEIADGFEQAAEIALLLGRLGEAKKLRYAAIAFFVGEAERGAGIFATLPALWTSLGLARIDRALGRYDDALFLFEKLASLGLGGSLDDGLLLVTPEHFSEIESAFPESSARLRSVAIAEALETLIHAGRYDLALTAARVRSENDPAWLDAFRHETTATALSRLGLLNETLVFLASATALHPPHTRLVFEQKRAETLAAVGKLDDAAVRVSALGLQLETHWKQCTPALPDVALAARVSLLLTSLGHHAQSTRLASAARLHARALGDVPLEAELALRVVESDAPSDMRADAADALTRIVLGTGYAITLLHGGVRLFEVAMPPANEPRAPTYPALRDRLYSIAA